MAKDTIARGLAIGAQEIAEAAALGLHYKGAVEYYYDLPTTASKADAYNVQKDWTDPSTTTEYRVGLYVCSSESPLVWDAITAKGEKGDAGDLLVIECLDASEGTLTTDQLTAIKQKPSSVEFEISVENPYTSTSDKIRYKFQKVETAASTFQTYTYKREFSTYNDSAGEITTNVIYAYLKNDSSVAEEYNNKWRRANNVVDSYYVSGIKATYDSPDAYSHGNYVIKAKNLIKAGSNITLEDDGTISATGSLAANWSTLVGDPTDNTAFNNWKTDMDSHWQETLSDGAGTVVNGTSIDAVMGYDFTTTAAVGNLPSGTTITASDTIIDILYKILNGGVTPVTIYIGGSGSDSELTNPSFSQIGSTLIAKHMSETDLVGQHKWNIVVGESGGPSRYACLVLPNDYSVSAWTAADSLTSQFNYTTYSIAGTGSMADYTIWYIPSYTWSYPDGTDYYITIAKN